MFATETQGYAGLPLEKVRFTSEDLFILLGGTDAAQFACSNRTMDFRGLDGGDAAARWRRDLVARFSGSGLVDESGAPCDELAAALAPLAKPGVVVADDEDPADGPDPRQAVAVRWGDCASGIVRAGGQDGGWNVVPFGSRERWHESFLRLFGVDDFAYSPFDVHVSFEDDPRHSYAEALLSGDERALSRWSAAHGISPEPLVSVARAFAAGPAHAPRPKEFVVCDYTGVRFSEAAGFTVSVPRPGGTYKMKHAQLLPSVGMQFAAVRAPRLDDPADWWRLPSGSRRGVEFGRIDFIHEGSAFDAVCDVPDHPIASGAKAPSGAARR